MIDRSAEFAVLREHRGPLQIWLTDPNRIMGVHKGWIDGFGEFTRATPAAAKASQVFAVGVEDHEVRIPVVPEECQILAGAKAGDVDHIGEVVFGRLVRTADDEGGNGIQDPSLDSVGNRARIDDDLNSGAIPN